MVNEAVVKSAYALIQERLGVPVGSRENPEATAMTTTIARIARANPNRIALIVVNLGANPVVLSPSVRGSATIGIRLGSNG